MAQFVLCWVVQCVSKDIGIQDAHICATGLELMHTYALRTPKT